MVSARNRALLQMFTSFTNICAPNRVETALPIHVNEMIYTLHQQTTTVSCSLHLSAFVRMCPHEIVLYCKD